MLDDLQVLEDDFEENENLLIQNKFLKIWKVGLMFKILKFVLLQ